MRHTTSPYKKLTILLCMLFMYSGMSCVLGRTTSHALSPVSNGDVMIAQDALSKETGTLINDTTSEQTPLVLDSLDIAQTSDSILSALPPMIPKFTPDPTRSLWLSLIFPGAGQIYNRKYWKLPIVYGGFLGCLYALTWNNQMLDDYSQAYLDIMDDDPNTKSYMEMLPINYNIEGREDQFKEIFKNKKNYYRKYRDMSLFAMIGVYLLSVVDAYVDAELSSFDISEDLSMKIEPAIFNGASRQNDRSGFGVQCKFNF